MSKFTPARSMGSHHRPNEGKSNDWLTPPEIVAALGPFDLDPCASRRQPWRTAETQWTSRGLDREWFGSVWLNPPYGPHVWEWLEKLAEHGCGVALIFARTETDGFFRVVWERASALYFIRTRLHFHWPKTGRRARFNAGAPSVLVGYGADGARRLGAIAVNELPGRLVKLRRSK